MDSVTALALQTKQHPMTGNKNSAKGKPWTAALRLALSRKDDDGVRALNRVADALIKAAIEGDLQAIREIGDRIEGKVSSGDTSPVRVYVMKDMQQLRPIDGQAEVVDDASP